MRTPALILPRSFGHLPHIAEFLPCGCIIVTFGGVRYRLKQRGEFVSCLLEDEYMRDWAMKQVEGMVMV